MLTPSFTISQTENQIILVIKATLANIKETELIVEDEVVIFYSSPYYLRLHLPGRLRDVEETCGKYDCDKGEFTFTLNKANEGDHFEDLDLLGKLLVPQKKHQVKPEIAIEGDVEEEDDDDEEWYYTQDVHHEDDSLSFFYGFANKTKGNDRELREEFYEIIDNKDAARMSPRERNQARLESENRLFSEDHYLADLIELDILDDLIDFKPPWCIEKPSLTQDEKNYLKDLGNRDYLLDSKETKISLLSLIDIIYAYAYDYRTTFGDKNVESAWTINKLSSTLSCFQSFSDITEVKTSNLRRSLIYPLYRNWKLSNKVMEDTYTILSQGKRRILSCLIDIHKSFNESEPRYLLNSLYITDYCIWLQKLSEKKIEHLALYFSQVNLIKDDIGLDLVELEAAAYSVMEDQDVNKCIGLISSLNMKENESSDSDPDSSESSESSDSESSESD